MNYPVIFPDLIDKTNAGAIPAKWVGLERWVCDETYGMRCYVPVYNGTGGTLLANTGVVWKTGVYTGEIVAGGTSDPVVKAAGILEADLPTGYWGWACKRGTHAYIADAAVAANAPVTTALASAAGRFDDTAVAGIEHCLWGRAVAAVAAAGDTGYMTVALP